MHFKRHIFFFEELKPTGLAHTCLPKLGIDWLWPTVAGMQATTGHGLMWVLMKVFFLVLRIPFRDLLSSRPLGLLKSKFSKGDSCDKNSKLRLHIIKEMIRANATVLYWMSWLLGCIISAVHTTTDSCPLFLLYVWSGNHEMLTLVIPSTVQTSYSPHSSESFSVY